MFVKPMTSYCDRNMFVLEAVLMYKHLCLTHLNFSFIFFYINDIIHAISIKSNQQSLNVFE